MVDEGGRVKPVSIAIIIPARYASTRFPGKPLALIGGRSMLSRTYDAARRAAEGLQNVEIAIATDDERIFEHAEDIGAPCLMTGAAETGSDRVMEAARKLKTRPDFILNLQGDAPFTPPEIVRSIIKAHQDHPEAEVITPVHQLRWGDLDRLREAKKTTPFSGTTAIRDKGGYAIWFSKHILPAIRKEDRSQKLSPVYQHIGLYGYRYDALEKFCALPPSNYEKLEGLEQLRFIENGMRILTIAVEAAEGVLQAGIDTPEDLERAEAALKASS